MIILLCIICCSNDNIHNYYITRQYNELLKIYLSSNIEIEIDESLGYLTSIPIDKIHPHFSTYMLNNKNKKINNRILVYYYKSILQQLIIRNTNMDDIGDSIKKAKYNNLKFNFTQLKDYYTSNTTILSELPIEYTLLLEKINTLIDNELIDDEYYPLYVKLIYIINEKKQITHILPFLSKIKDDRRSINILNNLINKYYTESEIKNIYFQYYLKIMDPSVKAYGMVDQTP